MKNEHQTTGRPEDEAQTPAPEEQDTSAAGPDEGRSGEGAHSAMKHWLHEERNRLKRPEH